MTRSLAPALVCAALAAACNRAHTPALPPGASCEEMGGVCQTPDLPCGPEMAWAGYDRCGDVDNNSCCLPAVDAVCGLSCLEPTTGEVSCQRGATVCSLEEVCCGTTGGCEPNGAAGMEPGAICPLYAECDDDADCTARGHVGAVCCVELGLGAHLVHRCTLRDECAMPACDDRGACSPSPY